MLNRRSRRLAAVVAAAGALTLLGGAGAWAAGPAQPAGQGQTARVGQQPDSGIAPLCLVMPATQGCKSGPIQK
jgi:hypothetical protein